MASTEQAHARRLLLDDLPHEVVDRITSLLTLRDLASLNATARLFHAAPPGGRSPVERALRVRAIARGHERALPAALPAGARTWTEELLGRERVFTRARGHATALACGDNFSAFVDADGGLHTCGEEEMRDDDAGRWTMQYRARAAQDQAGMRAVLLPSRVASLAAMCVCSVAAGDHHLLALSEDGTVYGCGDNELGQLGMGDTEERRSFGLVGSLSAELVVSISAGGLHSLALGADGRAFSWGSNNFGQLGHGDTKTRLQPTHIEALDGVRVGGVAAGETHTLLLLAGGAVYSCGDGSSGRLGHGDEQDERTPRRIEALAGVRAVHVSAGYEHSLVVDAAGGVHSFGAGSLGALGHGDVVLRLVPTRIDALGGVRAVRASAGRWTSAVVCADGSVHTFGYNLELQLGHPPDAVEADVGVCVPKHVAALAHECVVGCALSSSHALYATADGCVHSCGEQSAALGRGLSNAGHSFFAPAATACGLGRVEPLPCLRGRSRVGTAGELKAFIIVNSSTRPL